jgi:parallel beta-helix repeat protein
MKTFQRLGCIGTLLVAVACSADAGESEIDSSQQSLSCVRPRDNLDITKSTTLCPGNYTLNDVAGDGLIRIKTSGIQLTLTGVTLRGDDSGYGVVARNVSNVTVTSTTAQRGILRGFRAGVFIEGGGGHRVTNLDVSNNRRRPLTGGGGDFLLVWPDFAEQLAADQIGNGVLLKDVNGATIANNMARFQQNGVGLFGSQNVTVKDNNCSNNRGWGIHLHRSSNNTIVTNVADDVNLADSTFCHSEQDDGCDSAGILVIKASNDNTVRSNSFKRGGDGIFSGGRENTTHWGADRNKYIGNDVTGAKHLGIEATFADSLLVENNVVHDASRSGIWLGYSTNSIVRGNSIQRSGWSGIDNDSALNIEISNNRIIGSAQHGIHLRQENPAGQESAKYRITNNVIADNGLVGIFALDTQELTVTGNRIQNNVRSNLHFGTENQRSLRGPNVVRQNQILGPLGACSNVTAKCGCLSHSGNVDSCATEVGCAYYQCSNQCRREGTSNCAAGCGEFCTGSCRDHDGVPGSCNAAGCAYYFCSNQCQPGGTSCEAAGCTSSCEDVDPGPETPLFSGSACLLGGWFNLTNNYWGTTNTSAIAGSLCGSTLAFEPILTSPPVTP